MNDIVNTNQTSKLNHHTTDTTTMPAAEEMNSVAQRAQRILNRINELATITEVPGELTRTYGTAAFAEGRNLVEKWMKEAGLPTRTDSIGNLRATLRSHKPSANTFIIASHIDTVVNAGKFDGPLGVLLGLDLLEQLLQNNTQLPFNIELIAFCDEEGVRYHTTYLGSKVVAGSFEPSWLEKKDKDGISLREAITALGGNANTLTDDAIERETCLGYFEAHIEQGPVLYDAHVPVAVVTNIAGQRRVALTFSGTANHAGTVPMDRRQDALCCAAECISAVEQFALANKEHMVATVGKIEVPGAASNVIPGRVACTLDIRSASETFLANGASQIKETLLCIAEKRSIQLAWTDVQASAPVPCDALLQQLMADAIAEEGHPLLQLVSGAGHDAVPLSAIAPVSMMFVRCYKGISHNPLEDVALNDLAAAVQTASHFMLLLIKHYQQ